MKKILLIFLGRKFWPLDQENITIFSWSRSRPRKSYYIFLVENQIKTRPRKTSSSDSISSLFCGHNFLVVSGAKTPLHAMLMGFVSSRHPSSAIPSSRPLIRSSAPVRKRGKREERSDFCGFCQRTPKVVVRWSVHRWIVGYLPPRLSGNQH